MHRLFISGLAALSILLSTPIFATEITIGSWNVKRLGHGDDQSFEALGAIASKFDVVALQEVMSESGLDRMEAAVERASGEPWGRLESHLVGSRAYKEMYAFLYRESSVEYDEGAVVYLDRGDRFLREPFSAKFKSRTSNTSFALATVHILYGAGIEDRTPEIIALADYWQWLGDVYPGTERIMVGDFNLAPNHPAWAGLKQHAKPLITRGASTLSGKDGRFANLFDNIWIDRASKFDASKVGIVNYPRMLGWSHEKSRKHVSDHAPVYLSLGSSQPANAPASTSRKYEIPEAATASTAAASTAAASTAAASTAAASTAAASVGSVFRKPTSAEKPLQQASGNGAIIGNRNSMIYHRPDCPSYSQVSPKNQIEFRSAEAAQSAGYRIAGNCP